jgi:hypothetical protein
LLCYILSPDVKEGMDILLIVLNGRRLDELLVGEDNKVCNFLNPDEIFLGVVGVSVSDTFRA